MMWKFGICIQFTLLVCISKLVQSQETIKIAIETNVTTKFRNYINYAFSQIPTSCYPQLLFDIQSIGLPTHYPSKEYLQNAYRLINEGSSGSNSNNKFVFGCEGFLDREYYGFEPVGELLNKSHLSLCFTSQLTPSMMDASLRELILNLTNSENFIFITHEESTFDLRTAFQDLKGGSNIQFIYKKPEDAAHIASQMFYSNIVHFVLDLHSDSVYNILVEAKKRGLTYLEFHWLILFPDIIVSNVNSSWPHSNNMILVEYGKKVTYPVNPNIPIQVQNQEDRLYLDLAFITAYSIIKDRCQNLYENLTDQNKYNFSSGNILFKTPPKTIQNGNSTLVLTNSSEPTLERASFYFPLYSSLTNRNEVGLLELKSDLTKIQFRLDNEQIHDDNYFSDNIANLIQKEEIRVLLIERMPYVSNRTGFLFDMFDQIFSQLKMNVTYTYRPDLLPGLRIGSRQYTGALQEIAEGRQDILLYPFKIDTALYANDLQFTTYIHKTGFKVMYKPEEVDTLREMFQFIWPYHWHIWAIILGAIIVYALVLFILHLCSPNLHNYSFAESIFFTAGSSVHGVTMKPPDKPAARILVCFWWLFCLLVVLIFVANYGALRTNRRLAVKINDFSDLILQTTYKYGVLFESEIIQSLKESSLDYAQTIYRTVINPPEGIVSMPQNLTEATALVDKGKFAFLGEEAYTEYFSKLNCYKSVGSFDVSDYGIPIVKNRVYKKIIDDKINELTNDLKGYDFYFNKYDEDAAKNQLCNSTQSNSTFFVILDLVSNFITQPILNISESADSLTMSQSAGIFVIMIAGCIIVVIMALFELCIIQIVKKCKANKKKKKRKYDMDDDL